MKLLLALAILGLADAYTSQPSATYTNPVLPNNHPDPGVLALPENKGYIVTSTSNYAVKGKDPIFPIYFSEDLVHWELKGHIFNASQYPFWGIKDAWAPEIHYVDGNYVAYFVLKTESGQQHALGVARSINSSNPYGPYVDLGYPIIAQPTGSIDPTFFHDERSNKNYLIWKHDGPKQIFIQELEHDGIHLKAGSVPKIILNVTRPSDLKDIEGPWLMYKDPYYYLFFSCGGYGTAQYHVSSARSINIMGPYVKAPNSVVVMDPEDGLFAGPGHNSVVQTPNGDYWLVYHAWNKNKVGPEVPGRQCLIDKIIWNDIGWPTIAGIHPSQTPQPVPDV